MRLLLVHNRYRQAGGEDFVFEAERALLEEAGHEVVVYERSNDEIDSRSLWKLLDHSRGTVWATDSARSIRRILAESRPDIAHFHNIFPLVSPAAYHACASVKVPVVQTLSNYRLICPGGMLLRGGRPCEECVEKSIPWPGVRHRCYRGSAIATAVVGSMLVTHRAIGTWKNKVDAFIALSEFSRSRFIAGGLPAEKIAVKPNFVSPDPGPRHREAGYALFVGRLSHEKGLSTLLDAWNEVPNCRLVIAGDGPLAGDVRDALDCGLRDRVSFIGWRPRHEVIELMKGADFLVVPSLCYENFPLTIAEAFACGVPVVGSRLGGVQELVRHGGSGLLFEPGNASELATTARRLLVDSELRQQLSFGARDQFEAHYTAETNYEILMDIYERVLDRHLREGRETRS